MVSQSSALKKGCEEYFVSALTIRSFHDLKLARPLEESDSGFINRTSTSPAARSTVEGRF